MRSRDAAHVVKALAEAGSAGISGEVSIWGSAATRASRFGRVLRDLGLTSNQVWGLTKTDDGWSSALESALLETRRDDLEHGTNAAYVAGCVCRDVESASASGWRGIVAEGFLDLRQVEKAR